MTKIESYSFMLAFADLLQLEEEKVFSYVEKNGIASLVENALPLLSTETQKRKYASFKTLNTMVKQLTRTKITISSPEAASSFINSIIPDHSKEHFVALHLNTKNEVINYEIVSVGTLNNSLVHPREVFKNAVLNGSAAILFGHNHPSGNTTPSQNDMVVTKRLRDAGELMGIPVIDHVIVEALDQNLYSFQQEQMILEQEEPYCFEKENDFEL